MLLICNNDSLKWSEEAEGRTWLDADVQTGLTSSSINLKQTLNSHVSSFTCWRAWLHLSLKCVLSDQVTSGHKWSLLNTASMAYFLLGPCLRRIGTHQRLHCGSMRLRPPQQEARSHLYLGLVTCVHLWSGHSRRILTTGVNKCPRQGETLSGCLLGRVASECSHSFTHTRE